MTTKDELKQLAVHAVKKKIVWDNFGTMNVPTDVVARVEHQVLAKMAYDLWQKAESTYQTALYTYEEVP
jgi:hypothetical protein